MYLSKQLFAIGTSLVLGGNLLVASPSQTMNRTELPRRITIAVDESDSFGTICKVIAKLMGIDASEIKKSSTLIADLGMDSLDLVEVVMECEKQLSVSFPDEMWNKFGKNATVNDLVDAFDSLLKKDDKTSSSTISFGQAKANIKVEGTPYEMLVALLDAGDYPITDLSLETHLPYDVVEGLLPGLKKNMKIKDKVALPALPVPASVSEVLTAMMQAKYEKKSNKNKDFEKIRYSLNSSDFEQYIAKYLKSKHVADAEARRKCAEQHEDWLKAKKAGSRDMYEAYANKYYYGGKKPLEAPEGYETLVTINYQRARAIANWYDMLQSEIDTYWLTNGIIDCSIYTDYLDECGKYTCFTDVVNDSINRCLDRTAWLEADKNKSIASYQNYVDEFPDGRHARYAKVKLDDWKAWARAREENTCRAYYEYCIRFPEGDSVVLAKMESVPNDNDAVDLGLPSGTRWAPFNVGAFSPEECGDYYAWGETEQKNDYSWERYQYFKDKNGNGKPFSDGKTELGEIIDIGDNISGTEYDVAHVKWGGNWKMPTKTQCQELVERCKWTWWVAPNLQEGYKVTGPNGNSIFLPAAGYRKDKEITTSIDFRGGYWSSTRNHSAPENSYLLRFKAYDKYELNPNLHDVFANSLRHGRSIRPVITVKSKQQASAQKTHKKILSLPVETDVIENIPVINVSGHNAVDLGLPSGTKWADRNVGSSSHADYGEYYAWGETKTFLFNEIL